MFKALFKALKVIPNMFKALKVIPNMFKSVTAGHGFQGVQSEAKVKPQLFNFK
jgi:hypothetical protein